MAELLKDAQFRKADIFFDREYTLDLGGVRVRLLSLGPTHTRGDTIVWVEGDRILFAGDVVMNRTFVAFASPYSSVKAWLADFDQLEPLRPLKVVPSHGPVGDASLIAEQRTVMKAIQSRAIELKRQGKSADETAQTRPDGISGEVSRLGGAGAGRRHRPNGVRGGAMSARPAGSRSRSSGPRRSSPRWRCAPTPSRACRRPTASSGTSRTPRRGRRTAAASPPAAARTRSTASAT